VKLPQQSLPLGKQIIRSHALAPRGEKIAIGTLIGEVRVFALDASSGGQQWQYIYRPGDDSPGGSPAAIR